MDPESSPFESSEMLASCLASTPFLEESWRLCSIANNTAPRSFVADEHGEIGYLAFSGVQMINRYEPSCGTLLALGKCGCKHLFSPLECDDESEGTVQVDAGFLHLFLEYYQRQDFQRQILRLKDTVKVIILTGHSSGATIASLTALWLLSEPIASPISVLCLTFGSPLLGNNSLSRAILRKGWGGRFCNVVSKHDVVPELLLAPQTSLTLHPLLRSLPITTASPSSVGAQQSQYFSEFFKKDVIHVKDAAQSEEGARNSLYWPLGSCLFCLEDNQICLDNAKLVFEMMHLMLKTVSVASSFGDPLKCSYYTGLHYSQFLKRRNINGLFESRYEVGVCSASQSSRTDPQESGGGGETETKKPIPEKEKTKSSKEEMMMLALNVTSSGVISTAYFGVKRHKYLDWFCIVYVICLTLALVLVTLGGHSHHKGIMRLGSHFTLGSIVMMVVVAIAAAMLG